MKLPRRTLIPRPHLTQAGPLRWIMSRTPCSGKGMFSWLQWGHLVSQVHRALPRAVVHCLKAFANAKGPCATLPGGSGRPKNLLESEEFKERMPKRIEGKFLYSLRVL